MKFPTPHQSKVPMIESKIQAAREEFDRLKRERDQFALAAAEGDRAADKSFQQWNDQLKNQETLVVALEAALAGAKDADRQAFLAARQNRIEDCFDAIEKRKLNERAKLIAEFEELNKAIGHCYRRILVKTSEIHNCWPSEIPAPWQPGTDHLQAIRTLISHELWRHSGSSDRTGQDDKSALPAAAPKDLSAMSVPASTRPLAQIIAAQDESMRANVQKARAQLAVMAGARA